MRIAIPVQNIDGLKSKVSAHFGRAVGFIVYDKETEEVEAVTNTSEHMGGTGKPPELIKDSDVDLVLCSNLGGRAVEMFKQMGIDVCVNASGTAADAIEAWSKGELTMANSRNACQEHKH